MLRIISKSFRFLPTEARWVFLGLLFASLIANMLDIVALLLVGWIGLAISGIAPDIPFLKLGEIDDQRLVLFLVLGAGAAFTTKTAVGIWLARIRAWFLADIEIKFSRDIADSFFRGDFSRMRKHSRSELEWTIVRSSSTAITHVLGQSFQLFAEASLAVAIFVVFVVTDWGVAVSVLFFLVLVVSGFQFSIRNASSTAGKSFSNHTIVAMQTIADMVSAFREITVSNRSGSFLKKLNDAREKMAYAQAKQSVIEALPRLILEMAMILGVIALILFETFRWNDVGEPDYRTVAVFIVGTFRLMSALLPLQRAFMALRYAEPQADAAHKSLATIAEQGAPTYNPPITNLGKGLSDNKGLSVEVSDVSFSYSDESGVSTPALRNITMSVASGSSVGLIGPSGAGKSTLVDLILGLYSPDRGSVLISSMEPRNFQRIYPGAISYVPQKTGLLAGSLQDNIALGVPPDEVDPSQMRFALQAAKLESFAYNLPDGPNTNLGAQSDQLSGGQIQRLGIARALYTNPKLLVIDEGTSALDPETESLISNMLITLEGRVTIVVVAHRLSTVKDLNQLLLMEEGRISAQGSLGELRKANPRVQRYVELSRFL